MDGMPPHIQEEQSVANFLHDASGLGPFWNAAARLMTWGICLKVD